MSSKLQDMTFVVNRNSTSVFERNFAASSCLDGIRPDRIIVQEGFSSAAAAYNDAIEKADTDLLVFAHQDVYFPADWLDNLDRSLKILERSDPDWGVLGGWGVNNRGLQAGYLYSVGLGILGKPFVQPVAIDTLDEYFLIMRKSSGLRFDSNLPNFHLYGTDICLSARKNNKNCYAISAFSIHNTGNGKLPPEFFDCYWHVKKKWKEFLPIQTPCIRITRWNEELIVRKLKHVYFKLFRREYGLHARLEDPRSALKFAAARPSDSD
jgi:glycosyltransferase involved in cell wall biosynthesis